MKTILITMLVAAATTIALAQVDTAKNVVNSTVRGTESAAKTVAHGAAKAVDKVEDALEPEPDAHRVDVNLTEDKIDMPMSLKPGKTAFVVKNSGTTAQNFEVAGHEVDREFKNPPKPGETKVIHATLKRGTYTVYSPDRNGKKVTVRVR